MPRLPALRTRSYFRLWTFEDQILVECPSCRRCARASAPAYDRSKRSYLLHISCLHCTAQRDLEVAYDFFNSVRLWLKVTCCGEMLWALNDRHLTALEDFVAAGVRDTRAGPLRDRAVYGSGGREVAKQQGTVIGNTEARWQRMNSHMYSRLPTWMTSAKNRVDVMRGLRKLRTKLNRTALS